MRNFIVIPLLIFCGFYGYGQKYSYGSKVYLSPYIGIGIGASGEQDTKEFDLEYSQDLMVGIKSFYEITKHFNLRASIHYSSKTYYLDYKTPFFQGYNYIESYRIENAFKHQNLGGAFELGIGYKWIIKRLVLQPYLSAKFPLSQQINKVRFDLKENGTNNVRNYDIRLNSRRQPVSVIAGCEAFLHLGSHFGFVFSLGLEYNNSEAELLATSTNSLYDPTFDKYNIQIRESGPQVSVGVFYSFGSTHMDLKL